MKTIAVDKGYRRFRQAKIHLMQIERIAQAKENVPLQARSDALQEAWYGFLTSLNSIIEVLVTGGRKSSVQSKDWAMAKRREILDDPLLGYLFQARSSEFHGLDVGPAVYLGDHQVVGFGEATVQYMDGTTGKLEVPAMVGPELKVGDKVNLSPSFKLTTVTDHLHGNSFDPPTSHMQQPLADNSPLAVARLALAHYEALLSEADSRCS